MHNTFQYDSKQHAELLEMIDKKKTQRAELEEQIQSLSESVAGLAERYESLVKELPVMRAERQQLKDELTTLANTISEKEAELAHLIAQKRPHHDLSIEIAELTNAVDIAKREKEALIVTNDELMRERNDLETKIRIKTTRVAELIQDIQEKDAEHARSHKRLRDAEDVAASIQEKQTRLDASIAKNQMQIDELALQGVGVGTIVRKIQRHLDEKKIKVDVLKIIQ